MKGSAALLLALLLTPAPAAGASAGAAGTPPRKLPVREDAMPPVTSATERLAQILRLVQRAVVYPERARRRGIEGVTRIRFRVGPAGRAAQVATVATSGSALLDRAAEAGAREAGSLPYVYGVIEVPVRFSLRERR